MGILNLPKLLELYRELNSIYINEHGIFIIQEYMTKEEIRDNIDRANYISFIINHIEQEYIKKDKLTITIKELDVFIKTINRDVAYNVTLYSTIYTLYLKAIQLMEKK